MTTSPPRITAAEFVACLPDVLHERPTYPATMESGRSFVAFASCSTALSDRSMKSGFSTRSRGGYPVMESSGKTINSAFRAAASRAKRTISATLPERSPTVGLICPRAIRINIYLSGMRIFQDESPVIVGWAQYVLQLCYDP